MLGIIVQYQNAQGKPNVLLEVGMAGLCSCLDGESSHLYGLIKNTLS